MCTHPKWLWSSLACLLLAIPCVGGAQNLIPNPSFEVQSNCPYSVALLDFAVGWDRPVNHGGTPDYLHVCGPNWLVSVPNNAFGTQPAYHGDAYIGFVFCSNISNTLGYREYPQAQLNAPLVHGGLYEVSAYYSLADDYSLTTDKLQFYFSNTPPSGVGTSEPMSMLVPQASIPVGTFLTNQTGWTKVTAQFIAAGGEEYVTIGNFLDDLSTPTQLVGFGTSNVGYVYLDSLSLYALPPSAGPDTSLCPGTCYQLYAYGDTAYSWSTTTNPIPFSTSDTLVVCPTVTTSYVVTGASFVDTVTVTVLPVPMPMLGADTAVCQGQMVTLDAGNAGMDYLWSPSGAVSQTITVGAGGTYQVAVSNVCGTSLDSVTVLVEPLPTPLLGNDTTICPGANLPLNAGAGFAAYAWNTGATSQAIIVANVGAYQVTVTSALGCSGSDTLLLSQSPPIGLLFNHTDAACFGQANGSATAIPSGLAPFSYVWDAPGNPTTSTISSLASGTYTVTVTDALGCTRIGSVSIAQPAAIATTLQWTDEHCAGVHDGTASVAAALGFAPYSYSWSNGETTAAVDSLAPGTYLVTVTDAHGCMAIDSASIGGGTIIVATTAGNPSFCAGSGGDTLHVSASGGTSPYAYQWWCQVGIGPCGLDSIFDNDPIANPSQSGWNYVQVTDGNGCESNVDSVWLEVLPRPIVDAGQDHVLCGDSAPCQILTPSISGATGPFSYQWLPSAGLNNAFIANPCARPDSTTIYALVVTAGNGCSSNYTTTDTLATVTVQVNPIPIAHAGPDQHICLGDTATLEGLGTGAGPNYSFQWSPSSGLLQPAQGITVAVPSMTTTYTLVAWSNGCPSYGDDMTLFVHTIPTVNAGPDREICLGDTTLLDAQASGDSTASYAFLWTPNLALSGTNLEDPTVWPSSTLTYSVEARSNYGCGSSFDSVLVTLLPTPIADAGMDATICAGAPFQFQGSYHYTTTIAANPNDVFQSWTPGIGMDDSLSLTPMATLTQSGLYTLMVYAGTCATRDSMLLTVVPDLGLQANADTTVICAGDSVWMQAQAAANGTTFLWSPSLGVSDPNASGTWVAASDSTTYQVIASLGSCHDTAEIDLAVIPRPAPSYTQSLARGCAPLAVSFLGNGQDGQAYVWDFGDGSPVSNLASPEHIYPVAGTYSVSLTTIHAGGCKASFAGEPIFVLEPSAAAFRSSPPAPVELFLPAAEIQFFNEVGAASQLIWDFGDGVHANDANPTHVFREPGTYWVTLTAGNIDECISRVMHGPYIVKPDQLLIPNVFSPNGDGVNDVYLVNYTGSQPFALSITDRWGVKIYTGNNKTVGWDGRDDHGADVPDGVYYYDVKIGNKDYTGPVTLMR